MDLTNFIYDFNLSTTGTIKDVYEYCHVVNNGRKTQIDYTGSVSLYDVVDMFNNVYIAFLLDMGEFKNIISNLGREVIYGYHSISDDFAFLALDVVNPHTNVFDGKDAIVNFISRNNEVYAMADNGKKLFDKGYRSKRVDISSESVQKCLSIVEKHHLFLESYENLRNKFIFGNGTTVIFSKIDGDIMKELSTFTISFGNSYMNTYDFIEVKIKLGDELIILYDESKVEIRSEEINDSEGKKKIIDKLLRSIFVNSDNLCSLYKLKESEKSLRKRNSV